MLHPLGMARLIALVLAVASLPSWAAAAPIRYSGSPAELMISAVSPRMAQIVVAPLDEQGQPRPALASTALVPVDTSLKLRRREMDAPEAVSVGELRISVKLDPLTIGVTTASGKLVQELVLDDSTGALTFRTDAPVLGLGEGAHQFDRRGAQYPMLNGQRAPFLATHGGTIPVPFLIGTDGWAIYIHSPWGEFDLRDGRGRFLPRRDSIGKEPLVLFVAKLESPTDALTEYYRLTGTPIMPPKWVLGYFQSHRTLAGPQEPLQIARTFREKRLPCDALIYLGTGYCPAGWNVGHGTLDFNPKTFDKPAENIRALRDLNFKVVLHVNRAPRNMFGASITEEVRLAHSYQQLLGTASAADGTGYRRLVAGRRRRAAHRGPPGPASLLLRRAAWPTGPTCGRGASTATAMPACSATAVGSGRATRNRVGRRWRRTCPWE